jgi:hypothetical protein
MKSLRLLLLFLGVCYSCSQEVLYYHSKNLFPQGHLTKEEKFLIQKGEIVRKRLCESRSELAISYLNFYSDNINCFDDLFKNLIDFVKKGLDTEKLSIWKRKTAIKEIKSIKIIIEDMILLVALLEYKNLIMDGSLIDTLMQSIVSLVGNVSCCKYISLPNNFYQFNPQLEHLENSPPPFKVVRSTREINQDLRATNLIRKISFLKRINIDVLDSYLELSKLNFETMIHNCRIKAKKLLQDFKTEYIKLMPALDHIIGSTHGFGYIFGLSFFDIPENYMNLVHKLCCVDQINFQLSRSLNLKRINEYYYTVEFVDSFLDDTDFGDYLKFWIDLWQDLFMKGLTELIDYHSQKDEPVIVKRKIKLLKLVDCNFTELLDRVEKLIFMLQPT